MYWVAAIVILLFWGLMCLAGREEVPEDVESLLRPFYRGALYLYKKLSLRFPGAFRSKGVAEDLAKLYPGESGEILQTNYYVKKLAVCLAVAVVGSLLGAMAKLSASQGLILRDGAIVRGEYPEEEKGIQLDGEYAGENYDFLLQVGVRKLTEDETEVMFSELLQELPLRILGENESLQQVSHDLNLTDWYEGFPASVEWKSDFPDVVSRSGRVNPGEDTIPVVLTATLTYGEYSEKEYFAVTVVPPVLSEEERIVRGLQEALAESDAASAESGSWKLPESWEGQKVVWTQIVEDNSLLVGGLSLVTMVLIYLFADRDLHGKLEKRQRLLRLEYPELVHKLVLFVGAGMTIRGAFRKIASDSEGTAPVYEEMLYTCHELDSGVSEGAAYERFGKRTGLQEYIRLSTLLMQNLKRGNATLLVRLREEADRAAEERLHQSKKLGEEASTKLLLPMVMMLAVVMVIIMAPAFSAI